MIYEVRCMNCDYRFTTGESSIEERQAMARKHLPECPGSPLKRLEQELAIAINERDQARRERADWKAAHEQAVERAGGARVVEMQGDPLVEAERRLRAMIASHKEGVKGECDDGCDFITAWEDALTMLAALRVECASNVSCPVSFEESRERGMDYGNTQCPHTVLTSSPTTANQCAACGKLMPWPESPNPPGVAQGAGSGVESPASTPVVSRQDSLSARLLRMWADGGVVPPELLREAAAALRGVERAREHLQAAVSMIPDTGTCDVRAALRWLEGVECAPKILVPSPGVQAIAAERARQVSAEGYTADHDAQHPIHEFAMAAAAHALHVAGLGHNAEEFWPWPGSWKPKVANPARGLAVAGALIAAAIDALHAQAIEQPKAGGPT